MTRAIDGTSVNRSNKTPWEGLSMAEKAALMKEAVDNGVYDLKAVRSGYDSFVKVAEPVVEEVSVSEPSVTDGVPLDKLRRSLEDFYVNIEPNVFAGGGNKSKQRVNPLKQQFLNTMEQALKESSSHNSAQWRKFLTDLADMESSYNANITNNIGAKGYFQLMPFNRAKSWSSPTQQFHEMFKLTDSNLDYFKKNLTKEDWANADRMGIDIYGLLAGAHLGGVKGALNALRGRRNAKDSNGTSVMHYMKKFSQHPSRDSIFSNLERQVTNLKSQAADFVMRHSNSDVDELQENIFNTGSTDGSWHIPMMLPSNPTVFSNLTQFTQPSWSIPQRPDISEVFKAYDESKKQEELAEKQAERQQYMNNMRFFMNLMDYGKPKSEGSSFMSAIGMLAGNGIDNNPYSLDSRDNGDNSKGSELTLMPMFGNMYAGGDKIERRKGGKKEGITDEEYYNRMERVAQENYRQWGFNNPTDALVHALNDNTYDYRGFYNENPDSSADADTHWPDTYKTVWHPTFSRESKYSGKMSDYNPKGLEGGSWIGDIFIPSWWQRDVKAMGGNLFGGGGKKENKVKYKFDSSVYPHLSDTVGLLAEQVVTPQENYSILSPEGKNAWTIGTLEDLGIPLFTKTSVPQQVSEGITNQAANERADEYANKTSLTPERFLGLMGANIPLAAGALGATVAAPALFDSTIAPLSDYVAGTKAGQAITGLLSNPYFNTAVEAGFAGHGLNHAINEGIDGWGDAAMTALEVAPFGRLAKPVYEGVVQPGVRLFNSPLTGKWTKIGNREYRLSPNSFGANGSPLESRTVSPKTIVENAASMTPEQWTAAQDAAIARGDKAEVQRLRDLHFITKAPNTVIKNVDGMPAHVYHGTPNKGWNSYAKSKFGTSTDNGMYGEGLYATSDRTYADVYARGNNADGKYIGEIKDLYVNGEHPFYIFNKKDLSPREIVNREDAAYQFGRTLKVQGDIPTPIWDEMNNSDIVIETKGTKRPNFAEIVVPKGEQLKSADAVTYDDNGDRIPLGERDNFGVNDIRYDMPNSTVIESRVSAKPNIPYDEAYNAAAEGRHDMKNLVGSKEYADRVRLAYRDDNLPVNQADFEIMEAAQNIKDSKLKVVPNLKNAKGEALNGQYNLDTGEALIAQDRDNILDIARTSGHEHAHASEVEKLLNMLKKKWAHIKPRKEAYTNSDGSLDTEWKDYMSKITEMRAPAMSVWSGMKKLGFNKVGDYLAHLSRLGMKDKQWEALVDRYGIKNAKYMVETVFGISPLMLINKSNDEKEISTAM